MRIYLNHQVTDRSILVENAVDTFFFEKQVVQTHFRKYQNHIDDWMNFL